MEQQTECKPRANLVCKPGIILLAEDNLADQELVKRSLIDNQFLLEIYAVDDGVEAMEYLRREGKYVDPKTSPKPDILLLDINMPRMDGKEVLQEMKNDPALKTIPVIMLTTSDHEKDIIESYNLGVNAYITKPTDLPQFLQAMLSVKFFWLCVTQRPPKPE